MEGVHLLYLGGALGGAIVSLYQNGGCDETLPLRAYFDQEIQALLLRFLFCALFQTATYRNYVATQSSVLL